MGKVRVTTFGSPEEEEQVKKKAKEKKEARKLTKAPGLKGGERVVSVGPSEEELEELAKREKLSDDSTQQSEEKSQKKAGRKQKAGSVKQRSHRYQDSAINLDKSKKYSLKEALDLLAKFQKTKFDETIELHLNTIRAGISGNLTLPHGTGKATRVAVLDDGLIAEIETGKINFDVLVATPAMMPKLAKIAKVLGPRGLMPNPKNGTITQNPDEVIKKFEGGQTSFKTEAKAPLIHLVVGKFSFGEEKLTANIKTAIEAIKAENIAQIVLKSTMSPGIKIQL